MRALENNREDPQRDIFFNPQPPALRLYIDGASRGNPGEAGIGVVIKGSNGKTLKEVSKAIGVTTNNKAEYTALIEGLKSVIKLKGVHGSRLPGRQTGFTAHGLMIFSDSELLVKQLRGEYKVKDRDLKALYRRVSVLLQEFKDIDIRHILRENNKEADRLANRAIDRIRSRPDDRPNRGVASVGEESPSFEGQGAP